MGEAYVQQLTSYGLYDDDDDDYRALTPVAQVPEHLRRALLQRGRVVSELFDLLRGEHATLQSRWKYIVL